QPNKNFDGQKTTTNTSATSNKEKESPKDSVKKKVKFETSSDSSGDVFEMVERAKTDGVYNNENVFNVNYLDEEEFEEEENLNNNLVEDEMKII
uniref:Uncharacterized protein n=1 Tax=Meloidogyne javanica TaxID=6303 RepID=A0A915M9F4_MELJA